MRFWNFGLCFSVRPGVPDRSTKPSVCETKPTSSYNDTVRHLLANPNPPVPKIDRSLKARMILKTQACNSQNHHPIHPIFLRLPADANLNFRAYWKFIFFWNTHGIEFWIEHACPIQTQTEKTTDLGQVIDAESDLVEESIDLEKKTEELEDRWTILRLVNGF